MHLPSLIALTISSLAFANPLPEPVPAADDGGIAAIPGVNITNLGATSIIKNSYIVVYKDGATDQDVEKYEKKVTNRIGGGLRNRWRIKSSQAGKPGFSASHIETDKKGLEDIAKDPLVDFVELDATAAVDPILVNTTLVNSAPGAASLVFQPSATWGLGRISHKLKGFYSYIYDNTACYGTRIYVVDTGIRTTHVQFKGPLSLPWFSFLFQRAVWGKNFIAGSPNTDEHGHGTHCAGTAAGKTIGVCPRATVVAVKVLDSTGHGPFSGIIAGMQWAAADAIAKNKRYKSVISVSIQGGYSAAVNAAIQGIINSGIPVVVAAGNSNINAVNVSPASAPNAITVGSIDVNNKRSPTSNYGLLIDVFGPGVSVYSAYHTSNTAYATMSGTSQATPHVAGLAAYFMSKDGTWGAYAIRDKIVALSNKWQVIDAQGSPNRIAYNGNGA